MNDSFETEILPPKSSPALPKLLVPETAVTRLRTLVRHIAWRKILLFIFSLFLFILAITLMKEGARPLAPLVQTRFAVTNPANSLGFGWLFAYVIMSGSPVAAAALTFFEAGVIDKLGAFTMITGSRLGAGFIVLFIGFIYVLRGRDRITSLGMGLLSLIVTGSTYLVGLLVGLTLLKTAVFDAVQLSSGAMLTAVTDRIFDPLAAIFVNHLPGWAIFVVGLGIIMVSFNLFDKCLPQMALKESHVGQLSRLVYRPWVMFLLGAGITFISMSVSVSLSILVPLSSRGFVRRENVIPYIMGANITTFIDTLLAAVLLNNPQAFTIVFVEMTSITIVSVVLLLTIYGRYQHAMLSFVEWVTAVNWRLAGFMLTILIIPILLMLV